jgi:hypothetical protein
MVFSVCWPSAVLLLLGDGEEEDEEDWEVAAKPPLDSTTTTMVMRVRVNVAETNMTSSILDSWIINK